MLDFVPASFRVKVIRRPRYACASCDGPPVQAPAPPRPIDGGMASEALVAHVLVSKFAGNDTGAGAAGRRGGRIWSPRRRRLRYTGLKRGRLPPTTQQADGSGEALLGGKRHIRS